MTKKAPVKAKKFKVDPDMEEMKNAMIVREVIEQILKIVLYGGLALISRFDYQHSCEEYMFKIQLFRPPNFSFYI